MYTLYSNKNYYQVHYVQKQIPVLLRVSIIELVQDGHRRVFLSHRDRSRFSSHTLLTLVRV